MSMSMFELGRESFSDISTPQGTPEEVAAFVRGQDIGAAEWAAHHGEAGATATAAVVNATLLEWAKELEDGDVAISDADEMAAEFRRMAAYIRHAVELGLLRSK